MKRFITLGLILILVMTLIGCNNNTTQTNTALLGEVYIYEKGGFGGFEGDNFVISIRNDGTWTYTEGMASSHLADPEKCSWTLEDGILALTEKRYNDVEMVNYFRVEGDSLVYQAEGSDNFIYTKVEDGDKFNLDKKDTELKAKIVDKTFTYPNSDSTTSNVFTISINKDGTLWYSESSMLSIIHYGNWFLKDDILRIVKKVNDEEYVSNYFKISGDTLVYQEDNSDNFHAVKLPDGAVFNIEE